MLQENAGVCGVKGLKENDKLPEPIMRPPQSVSWSL